MVKPNEKEVAAMRAALAGLEHDHDYLASISDEQWFRVADLYRTARTVLERRHAMEVHALAIMAFQHEIARAEDGGEPMTWLQLLALFDGERGQVEPDTNEGETDGL